MTTHSFRPFTDALRKQGGWTKTDDIHRSGVLRYRCYNKQVVYRGQTRLLDLQLWGDGHHRISFWMNGYMSTEPTGFTTVTEMLAAIKYETTRSRSRSK